MKLRLLLSTLFIFLLSFTAHAQLRINEFMASNSNTLADGSGEYDDWIEIYNADTVSVNLAGMYVSDDATNPTKWKIPTGQNSATTIGAKGFLILWADGTVAQGATHLGFKLSASGEAVLLTAANGTTLYDFVEFGQQSTDVSYGRVEDGSGAFDFMEPTPNATNSTITVIQPSEPPVLSLKSGFYSGTIAVGISAALGAEVRFETGGKIPTAGSALYTSPISFDSSTVIRAVAFENGKGISPVTTSSYLLEAPHTIPVVNLTMDPDSLFGYEAGMYALGNPDSATATFPFFGANFWQAWEYPANLELIEIDGQVAFNMDAGASIAGNFSRGFNKKSFTINNNEAYGPSALEYNLFPENDYTKYDGFGLKAGAEERSRLLNELMYAINQEGNHYNAMQANRPSILYINGKYWGNYMLIERKNDDFVKSRYGYDDIDMIKDFNEVKDGDYTDYLNLVLSIDNGDASSAEFFTMLDSRIDLKSFTDHWIYQVYTSHGDANNVRYWRPRQVGGKWHYISHDFDWWRNLGIAPENYFSSLKYYMSLGTYDFWIIGKMLENPTYKEYYLNRMADLMNTSFETNHVLALIDTIDTAINPEMPRDIARWSEGWIDNRGLASFSMEYFRTLTEDYARSYPDFMYKEVKDTLLTDTLRVNFAGIQNGRLQINSIQPEAPDGNWSGLYFENTTIQLQALPTAGYEFTGWSINGQVVSTSREFSYALTNEGVNIELNFIESNKTIVINEINYSSAADYDTGDWVELYNISENAVDLSGWILKDEDDTHTYVIPENTVLNSGSYLVIVRSQLLFSRFNPEVTNVIGDFLFGLGGITDQVRIFNAENQPIDQVTYDSVLPWANANATGATIQLTDANSDNTLAEFWVTGGKGGTPGAVNEVLTSAEEEANTPNDFYLSQNYPNPFNPTTNISFNLPNAERVELSVYNLLGQKVQTLLNDRYSAGTHMVTFDAGRLASGIYIYRLSAGNQSRTQKMVLLK